MTTMPPRAERALLTELANAGGSAKLDQFARLMVGQLVLPGSPNSWLKLVAGGFVGGERGLIILTEEGRAAVL